MKRRIRRWITGIMTASILSQFLGGTVSMAADREAESVSADSAVVLVDTISDGEELSTDDEETVVVSDNSGSSDQNNNLGTDDDVMSANAGNDTVTASTEELSGDETNNGTLSDNDAEFDGKTGETVSGDNAGDSDLTDTEEANDRLDEGGDAAAERGVLESELSSEPYIFTYDSFSVEWRVVSHWEGACNVSVKVHNRSDETIHNWTLSFLSEDEIINPYNAKITSEGSNGNKWTLKNLEYNQDIRPGESIQFGFQLIYGERVDIPFSYSIDSSEKNVAGDSYEITNNIISSWDGGSVGEIHIVNNTDTAIEDWTVTVRTDAVFLTVWGGNIKKVSEDTYEFSCPDYCQNIAPGQTAVIGYQLSGHDTAIEILGLKEWGNKDNTISGNSISDNSVSNNTISENSVSNNSVSDNSVSENKPVTYIESDGHQHIFIDSEEYELLEEGIYLLDVYSDSMTGYISYENEDQNDSDNENYNENEPKVESVKLEICDVFDETIWEGDILSDDGFETWSAKETGFVLGANKLIFDVIFSDGTAMKEELFVINREASNIKNTFIELTDEDDDNIYDYYEKYFGTDPDKKDTDSDGLEDGAELFLLDTDPTDDDTDDDGTKDGDEDEDGDGLNVLKEYELGTFDLSDDSDLDELSDSYEVNVLGTDPTFADTDFDKITDKEEIDLGLDPLNPDSDGDGIIDGDETITREVSKDYNGEAIDKVCVSIGCKGSMENKLFISKAADKSGILHDTAGLIGDFYDIECDADFETADIIFSYDESMLGDTDESDLRLIWYNDEAREFVLLKDSVVDTENNTVSYTTTHFSKWGVVDARAHEEAYATPNAPGMSGTDNPYMNNDKFKYIHDAYIISLDLTASQDDIERQLQVTQAIIDQMDGFDRLYITCYGSKNVLPQPYYYSDLDAPWNFDGEYELSDVSRIEEILDYNNNNVYVEEGSTYTGHVARELARIAGEREFTLRSEIKSPYNKNYKAYVFYSGSFYDDNIDEFLDSPVTYLYGSYDRSIRESISLADNNDIIINTVSIAAPYGANEYMDELVPKTGGKSYSDADGTADGMKDLINEITKDLDSQKKAQRQGDYDGDGLSDRAELDGMLGTNGRMYYSSPYTTDVDHDTDGDDVPDNVEMGDYDPETGMYNVLSDPSNPNSIPTGYIRVPVYIIAWSYGTTYDVEPFEKRLKWDDTYSDLRKGISLVVDGYTDEWNQNVWEAFEEQSLFRWAAETKKRELINSGISESQIILLRIDGGAELISYWKEWQTYEYIQELHFYSHGVYGKPEMNNGGTLGWDGSKGGHLNSVPHNPDLDYPKLNFTENASVYFYGCHIAMNKNAEGRDFYPNGDDYLQLFSDYQQVKVFANRYGTSFSSDPDVKELIFEPSIQNVYLGSYALDDFVMPHEDYSERSLGEFGIDNNYAIKYFDMGTQVNEFFVSNKLKRIPFVIYTPGEPIQ